MSPPTLLFLRIVLALSGHLGRFGCPPDAPGLRGQPSGPTRESANECMKGWGGKPAFLCLSLYSFLPFLSLKSTNKNVKQLKEKEIVLAFRGPCGLISVWELACAFPWEAVPASAGAVLSPWATAGGGVSLSGTRTLLVSHVRFNFF